MTYPNFIMIGPAKTGTTSVFNWLSEHPEVLPAKVKETYFFYHQQEFEQGIKNFTEDDFKRYAEYFPNWQGEKIIFEATPRYASSMSALKAFLKINPKLKVLFIYRDPVERAYSEFSFHKYKTKSFSDSFADYVGYSAGNFSGFRVEEGRYNDHIPKWIEAFGLSNVIMMRFENLKDQPKTFMSELCKFLEISPSFYDDFKFESKNKTMKIRNRKIHLLLLKLYDLLPKSMISMLTPIYYKLNSTRTPNVSNEEKTIMKQLKAFYKDSQELFEKTYESHFISMK